MTLPRARIHTSALRDWRVRFCTQRTGLVMIAVLVTALFVWPFTLLFAPSTDVERLPALRCTTDPRPAVGWRDVVCAPGKAPRLGVATRRAPAPLPPPPAH